MKEKLFAAVFFTSLAFALNARAASTVIAEDDASQSAYGGAWDNSKNGGSGFGNWTLTAEGNDNDRHSGFFIAETKNNPDLNGIVKNDKAFGMFANGSGFEQAVAYRSFEKPLAAGDSFSFMIENGTFEKKFDKDDPTPGSIGLVLRSGNANSSVADYNKDALFEFGYYNGKDNYQIYDGSGADKVDSGVPFTDAGVSITVTITGADSYDLEIQTMNDKKVTKLPGRKLSSGGSIQSFAIFDRNGEKYDAFFNQFQVARESPAH
ncbi:MAG: hypothetical protein QOG67_205 [Verrucomicrobiota bacterium]|jgi:hypothetical protein